jgi:hypothetical protein
MQVDFTNAFAQAEMQEEVYVEPPKMFATGDGTDRILQLLKSLYGLKQDPKTFYQRLSAGLKQHGFIQYRHDTCMFPKQGLLCVIYVEDTTFAGPNELKFAEEIAGLGVRKYETKHKIQLRDEGEVGDFPDIRIAKEGEGTFLLTQTGLIDKIIKNGWAGGLQPLLHSSSHGTL